MGDSDYSFSLTTFAPSGKLVAVENALAAVGAGTLSVGVKAKNGVVIAVDKKVKDKLCDTSTIRKVEPLFTNVGCTFSGMGPDFRVLVSRGRKQASLYHLRYEEEIPIGIISRDCAEVMQEYTQEGGVRPFGISLLVAGYDHEGPHLFQVDPSGAYFPWKATACGKNYINAKTFLEKRYNDDMELEDAIHTAILTLKESFDGVMDEEAIEIGVVGEDRKFKVLTPAEVKDYLQEVE
ncbi:unnamed protein product [Vitrella brassicaformis CCMP3155]|uniref:Proteasome subunit alpha type n=1 Tax=Vitrella brassicaformis (strain CCMP3155) TaxID=1169540 RepID=A0A0G4GK56_VITBC|nr:unnamed protein product [Vitrella brassicaformis CCMP3155]|mmetsp:Transcript_21167/g.51631  ORF Transcript_21167/g.51631 Transcript_21167/m.51631 type:complete len:236 (+) Transcript_21167:4500-5207(+)|eukprot:CEM30291.1 unnamed protein product [Vitrella brassicaformis CCMP3155]